MTIFYNITKESVAIVCITLFNF